MASLKAAVKASEIDDMKDCNRGFDIVEYPASTTRLKMYSDIVGYDEADIDEDWFEITSGASAVREFSKEMRANAAEDEEDGEYDSRIKVYRDVADAVEGAFLPTAKFSKVEFASHDISEDGDTEHKALIATKDDGSYLVLSYFNNPY